MFSVQQCAKRLSYKYPPSYDYFAQQKKGYIHDLNLHRLFTIMEPISNVLTDKIPPRRSELFLIKKMRTLFLLIAYVCVAAFFAWKLYKLCQHETKLIYQMDYGDISAPST